MFLPYQDAWTAETATVAVAEKGRRIGLSWAEAAEDARLAARTEGMNVYYISYNKEMTAQFAADVAVWSQWFGLAAEAVRESVIRDEGKDILTYTVRFASGHEVVCLASFPRTLRSKKGKVVIDEAAFCDDLPGLITAARALLIWGGSVRIISTHNGDDNPFAELVQDIRAGKLAYALHSYSFSLAVEQGLYQRICSKLGRQWSAEAEAAWIAEIRAGYLTESDADEELECVPRSSTGAYLPRAVIEACMDPDIPVLRRAFRDEFTLLSDEARHIEVQAWLESEIGPRLARLPKDHPVTIGMDFGRTGDLSVIAPLCEDGMLRRRAPFVVELRNCPFKQQEQTLYYIISGLPRFGGAALDARGIGMTLAEYAAQKYGQVMVKQVMLSNAWYLENMPRYKAAFEDRVVVLPRDADVLDDHRALRSEKGVPKVPDTARSRGRDGGQRHGDSAIAGCLSWAVPYMIAGGPIEYETVETSRGGGLRKAI